MSPASDPPDFVRPFLFEELQIRGALVRLTSAWRRMTENRAYPAHVQRLLGEMTAVVVMVGSNLKQRGRLTFQVQGHGPIGLLVIDCTVDLGIRGLARFAPDSADAPVREMFGDGRLVLTLQNEISPHPYQSMVPLEGESIAAIFEHYLTQSEQLPARLFLAASVDCAAGLFIQKLPGADHADPDGWARIESLAATTSAAELAGAPSELLLARLFPGELLRVFRAKPVRYDCPYDCEKVHRMLRALGRDEVVAILREVGHVEVHDEICHRTYRLDASELAELFDDPSLVSARSVH
jgi:molecular chaperone Hsp33